VQVRAVKVRKRPSACSLLSPVSGRILWAVVWQWAGCVSCCGSGLWWLWLWAAGAVGAGTAGLWGCRWLSAAVARGGRWGGAGAESESEAAWGCFRTERRASSLLATSY
jgi:hypothetical protein